MGITTAEKVEIGLGAAGVALTIWGIWYQYQQNKSTKKNSKRKLDADQLQKYRDMELDILKKQVKRVEEQQERLEKLFNADIEKFGGSLFTEMLMTGHVKSVHTFHSANSFTTDMPRRPDPLHFQCIKPQQLVTEPEVLTGNKNTSSTKSSADPAGSSTGSEFITESYNNKLSRVNGTGSSDQKKESLTPHTGRLDQSNNHTHQPQLKKAAPEVATIDQTGMTASSPIRITRAGLTNLGNSCYMNAVLQCLAGSKDLMTSLRGQIASEYEFTEDEYDYGSTGEFSAEKLKNVLPYELNALFSEMKRESSVLKPGRIKSIMGMLDNQFNNNHQQDSFDFLNSLLQNFMPAIQDGNSFVGPFNGEASRTIECLGCQRLQQQREPFVSLALPVLEASKRCTTTTLVDCLRDFGKCETLDQDNMWMCPRCNKKRKTKHWTRISEVPQILVVRLNRFMMGESRWVKNNMLVDCPTTLELDSDLVDKLPPDAKIRYNLYAVINHEGTLDAGHYCNGVE